MSFMATWSSALAAHLVPARVLERREAESGGKLGTGMAAVDDVLGGGWPRGALSELAGPRGSGRTTLLCLAIAQALAAGEAAALIDVGGGLDPRWAQTLGVPLERLLWVRCHDSQALPAADLVLSAGGFGLLAIDFGDLPVRVPTAAWQRLKRTATVQRTAVVLSSPFRPQGLQARVGLRLDPGRPVFRAHPEASPLLLEVHTRLHLERAVQGAGLDPANTFRPLPLAWPRHPPHQVAA